MAMLRRIGDWDDAYQNALNIPGGEQYPEIWAAAAEAFRSRITGELGISYGPAPRQAFDLFRPEGTPKGLVVFVHGGYWLRFDRSIWSHLAAGPIARGWAVAIPSYTLCPEARVGGITLEIASVLEAASDRVAGPIRLVGHSAGGHLVTRMMCADVALSPGVAGRVAQVLSLSGLHDLRPLLRTETGVQLGLDPAEASSESPALRVPRPGTRLVAWVGGGERAEFRRQAALIANVWIGLGAQTACVEEPDRHHFDIVDGLTDPESALCRALLA